MSMDSSKVKKKSNIGDGPLRIDHSDVYFENDRLSEELGIVKNILLKYKHRQHLTRDGEIKELRKTIGTLEAMKKSSHQSLLQKRPQTTPAYLGRPQRLPVEVPPRVVKLNVHIPNEDSDESDSDLSDDSSLISGDTVPKRKSFIRPQVLTKSQLLRSHAENKKFPTSWYTDVLDPSDAIVKKTTSASASLSTLEPRRRSSGNLLNRRNQTPGKTKSSDLTEEADLEPRLVCGRSKSAVLSRRKLIQMTNLDHIADPEEKEEPVQILRDLNREHNQKLQIRVKQFLDDLDELKKKQTSFRHSSRFTNVYGNNGLYNIHEPLW